MKNLRARIPHARWIRLRFRILTVTALPIEPEGLAGGRNPCSGRHGVSPVGRSGGHPLFPLPKLRRLRDFCIHEVNDPAPDLKCLSAGREKRGITCMYLLLAQGMGFAGLVLNLLAYQCRNSRRLILTQLGSNITYVIHFLMLGAYTGCLSLSIMMLSNALLSLRRWRWAAWPGWRGVLCALFLAAAAVTWQGWLSVLPCVGTMTAAMSNWTRNGKIMRLGRLMIVSPCWLIYDVFVGSWSGVLDELLGITSLVISICRYGLKELDRVD